MGSEPALGAGKPGGTPHLQLLHDHAHVRLGRPERQVRGVQPHHPGQLQHHQRPPPAQPFRWGSVCAGYDQLRAQLRCCSIRLAPGAALMAEYKLQVWGVSHPQHHQWAPHPPCFRRSSEVAEETNQKSRNRWVLEALSCKQGQEDEQVFPPHWSMSGCAAWQCRPGLAACYQPGGACLPLHGPALPATGAVVSC